MAQKTDKSIVKAIINKLFGLVIVFYSAMAGATKLELDPNLIKAMENAGTLTLGSWLTLIKDKFDDEENKDGGLSEDPIASNSSLTASEVYEDQDWS